MKSIPRSTFRDFCCRMGLDATSLELQMDALVDALRLGDDPDEDEFVRTHARSTDHNTSHEAAASVLPTSPTVRTMVLLYHAMLPEPEIDETAEIFFETHWNLARSGVRTRRDELVKRGLMESTGACKKTTRGRNAVTWRLTGPARRALARYGVAGPSSGAEDDEAIVVSVTFIEPTPPLGESVEQSAMARPLFDQESQGEGSAVLPLWDAPLSEPPARVVPLDEDTGHIRRWWTRDW